MKNKNILVSGSSQGLGYATAEELASRGANVFIGSRNIASIETAAKKIKETAKGKVEWGLLDVTNEESIAKWINEGAATLGSIDGLVVNAGGPKPGTFEQLSTADWEQGFRLTLMGAVNLINAAIPHFKSNNSGAIVTITSLSVKEPIDILLLSNVFRAGVTSLAKSLSNELAKYNIRVNNIMPGRFNTERIVELDTLAAQRANKSAKEIKSQFEEKIPLGRYGNPKELAKAAAFLLSDDASYITGQSLAVDGGIIKTVW